MSKNHDIDSTRQIVVLARNAGIGVKPGLVLAILQELEETRAKHRKEWGRAEDAERRLSAAIERKEIYKDRVRTAEDQRDRVTADRNRCQDLNRELVSEVAKVKSWLGSCLHTNKGYAHENSRLNSEVRRVRADLQAAEAKIERVRAVCESDAFECNTREWGNLEAVATDDVLRALDGGEQE